VIGSLASRLRRAPVFGRQSKREAIRRLRFVLRWSVLVENPWSFAYRELARRGRVGRCRPRGSAVDIYLRHDTSDLFVLIEVFGLRQYEPPPSMAAQLAALGRPLRIVDLGSHVGMFGAFALGRFAGASLLGFEPDRDNLALLRKCVENNRMNGRWEVIEAFASNRDGSVQFLEGRLAESQVASAADEGNSRKVEARDIFAYLGGVDLLKLDIEVADPAGPPLCHPAPDRADDGVPPQPVPGRRSAGSGHASPGVGRLHR
jgi:FkbM family methyltransferase